MKQGPRFRKNDRKFRMISKVVYGPVPSKRLGRSLGIDVIKRIDSKKNCNFDCVYCQLGHVDKQVSSTEKVRGLVTTNEVENAFLNHKKRKEDLDYITFSGTCEPTLNPELGDMIKNLKEISDIPVCVITNSSMMDKEDVRWNLSDADLVIATLVSGFEETFEAINRPAPGIKLENIINGLNKFQNLKNQNKNTELAIEIMFIESKQNYPINTTDSEINKLIEVSKQINPDIIEILTVSRPPAENHIIPVTDKKLREISEKFIQVFGSEKVQIMSKNMKRKSSTYTHNNLVDEVYSLILRRPCTFEQVCNSLGISKTELSTVIDKLVAENKLTTTKSEDEIYYKIK